MTDISIIIPTLNGGEKLSQSLAAIRHQSIDRSFEIICVDSGSSEADIEVMHRNRVRIVPIDQSEFDHGLTRDLGADEASGEILVFINQDAVPKDGRWLATLTHPLIDDDRISAVQGGIEETDDPTERFFWDSCGERFYFTRESDRWIARYGGIGFSTVNAAIRREVWVEYPFGAMPIMEDKMWQKRVVEDGHTIRLESQAAVIHTHNYDLRSLWRRCLSEGFGWRLLGERYSFADMVQDGLQPRVHKDLMRGLVRGRIASSAEFLFPLLRPTALYWGNHWSRSVKL